MMHRLSLSSFVIFGLCLIGILSGLIHRPNAYVIPVFVLGGIFLLYKFLPRRPGRGGGAKRFTAAPKRKSRTSPFRVIPGTKRSGDDDTPKYH